MSPTAASLGNKTASVAAAGEEEGEAENASVDLLEAVAVFVANVSSWSFVVPDGTSNVTGEDAAVPVEVEEIEDDDDIDEEIDEVRRLVVLIVCVSPRSFRSLIFLEDETIFVGVVVDGEVEPRDIVVLC